MLFNAFGATQNTSGQGATQGGIPAPPNAAMAPLPKGPYTALQGYLQLVQPIIVNSSTGLPVVDPPTPSGGGGGSGGGGSGGGGSGGGGSGGGDGSGDGSGGGSRGGSGDGSGGDIYIDSILCRKFLRRIMIRVYTCAESPSQPIADTCPVPISQDNITQRVSGICLDRSSCYPYQTDLGS